MTPVPQPTALVPSVRVAIDRFLARSRFAARTRDSYAQDLAPLLAQIGDQRVSALTHGVASAYLAAHQHLAASTFNRRYAALRSFARWCKAQSWLHDDPLVGLKHHRLIPTFRSIGGRTPTSVEERGTGGAHQLVTAPSRRRQCGASQGSNAYRAAASSSKVTPRPGAVGSGKLSPAIRCSVGNRSRG